MRRVFDHYDSVVDARSSRVFERRDWGAQFRIVWIPRIIEFCTRGFSRPVANSFRDHELELRARKGSHKIGPKPFNFARPQSRLTLEKPMRGAGAAVRKSAHLRQLKAELGDLRSALVRGRETRAQQRSARVRGLETRTQQRMPTGYPLTANSF